MIYPYEILNNTSDSSHTLFKADEILNHGWERRGYEVINLFGPIPWEQLSEAQRSHNFYIQSFDMLDLLLSAYSKSSEIKYIKPCVTIALDWIEQHITSPIDNISPFTWYDMAVGLRVYRIAYLYEVLLDNKLLSKEQEELFWETLNSHIDYLALDENIAFHNNHGYYQIAGQIAAGRRFKNRSEKMMQAFEQGQVRLSKMIHQQFAEDGVHREHSPDYHRMVYDTLKSLIDSKLINNKEVADFANKIEESLSWFVFPNQSIVNFGDSDARSVSLKKKHAEAKWNTAAMQYVASGGEVGQLPAEAAKAFNHGGYWIVRQPSPDSIKFSGYSYLALNAAFHSRTHKHADDLSFVWYEYGVNILVDAGRYGYIGKTKQGSKAWLNGNWYADPMRIYCESTRAHNCLEFNDKDYPRRGVKPYGSGLKRTGQTVDGVYFAEAESKYFKSIRHARTLIYKPRKWLIVLDWFHDNLKKKHNVKQWFHFDSKLQLQKDEVSQQFVADVPSASVSLRIASLVSEPELSDLYLAEEEHRLQGWWSPKEREAVPSYALSFNQKNTTNGNYATLFCFTDKLSVDQKWSKINVSGRKGQLRWTDDEGQHEVKFERYENETLVLSFE